MSSAENIALIVAVVAWGVARQFQARKFSGNSRPMPDRPAFVVGLPRPQVAVFGQEVDVVAQGL